MNNIIEHGKEVGQNLSILETRSYLQGKEFKKDVNDPNLQPNIIAALNLRLSH